MAMEPFYRPVDLGSISPEHIVSEHRVGVALATPSDADGKPDHSQAEYAVALGFYNGDGDAGYLVGLRLLSVQQASQLGAFLLETSAHARSLNAKASAEGKEGV